MAIVTLGTGLELSCEIRGRATGPTLVLLPGPTDSWRSYLPVLDLLPADLHVVAVSMRGHGASDTPPDGYDIGSLAADVVGLLDALRIGRAVLVGHSGSCLVARRVAIDHPDRVLGLVLEASPTTLRHEASLREFVESVVATLEDPIDPELVRSFVTDTSSAGLPPALVDMLVEEALRVPATVWKQLFPAVLDHDDTAELASIRAPTLLLWGGADSVVPRQMQDELVAAIPHAELVVHPGVGHTPRWEAPALVAADVTGFVGRISRGAGAPSGQWRSPHSGS